MKEEVRQRLEEHREITQRKAEAEQRRLEQEQREQEAYAQWLAEAKVKVVEPAWAKAIATLREAGFKIVEIAEMQETHSPWNFAITSPHSTKDPRTTSLDMDEEGFHVYRDRKRKARRTLHRGAKVQDLVELILELSVHDLGPFN